MLLAVATAVRGHTSERVTPLLNLLPHDEFYAESVPSHAAQDVIHRFNTEFTEYGYRERALNPTNIDDLAGTWETDVIQQFRADENLVELTGVRVEQGREVLYIAQPIQVGEAACLTCHGKPEAAPASLIAAYGSARGFGWKQGETVAAKIVTVPKTERVNRAIANVSWFLIAMGSVLLLAFLVVVGAVERLVVRPTRQLAEGADRLSRGDVATPELTGRGSADLRTLATAINRLHRSLRLALRDRERE